ncbi:MAG: hypothetical protein ACLQDF_06415 [Desulfomonilia bacterium]
MVINTVFWAIPFHILALTKVLIRSEAWQRSAARLIMVAENSWIQGMNAIIRLTQNTLYDIKGLEGLSTKQWYFIN